VFRKQAAYERLARTSFRRQLLGKLLVQRWRGSSGNIRLTHPLVSFSLHFAMQLCWKELTIRPKLLLYCIVSVSYMMLMHDQLAIAKFLVEI